MKKLIFIGMWYILVQSSDVCQEPLYYEVEFNDGVIHKWSREIYHNIYGDVERLDHIFAEKYNNLSNNEINILTSREIMNNNRKIMKAKMDSIINSI
jgi:hypothetical protein